MDPRQGSGGDVECIVFPLNTYQETLFLTFCDTTAEIASLKLKVFGHMELKTRIDRQM